jgi:hypothetical protein
MSKDNQNCNTKQLSVTEILKDGYALLDSNVRKDVGDMLDRIFVVKQGWIHWKNRFLYPVRNIPKKNFDEYSCAMLDSLVWGLQKQVDIHNGKIEIAEEKMRHLHLEKKQKEDIVNQCLLIINNQNNEQKG